MSCRLPIHWDLDDLAVPAAEHRQQRSPGLGKGKLGLGKAGGERRLDDNDVGGQTPEERCELVGERGQRGRTGEVPSRQQAPELDRNHPPRIAFEEAPPGDAGPRVQAEDARQLS